MTKTHARTACLLMLFPLFLFPSEVRAQAEGDMQARVFDISRLTAVHRNVEGWPLTPPLIHSRRIQESGGEPVWRGSEGGLSPDMVLDLIHTALPGKPLQEPGALSAVQGGSILVRQKPAVLDRVEHLLEALAREAAPEIRITIYTVPASSLRLGATPPLLDRAGVTALLGKGAALRAASGVALPGGVQVFRSGPERAFVGDYDVEVAQEARIADPRVYVLSLGLDLKVEVRPLPGGAFHVRAGGRMSELVEMRQVDPESSYLGKILLPAVASQCVAGSGAIPSGGGLVLGWSREEMDRLILVQVERKGGSEQPSSEPVTLVPGGLAGAPSWNLPPMLMPGVGSSASGGKDASTPEPFSILDGDLVLEAVRTALGEDTFRQERTSLFWERPYFVVVGPRELGARVAGVVREFHQGLIDSRMVEVRCGIVDDRRAALLAGDQTELETLAEALPQRGFATTRPGDEMRLQSGIERAYLKDQDVEIAQEAQIADPVTDVIYEGVGLTGRLLGGPGADLLFSGELVWRGSVEPIATFQGNADDVGVVELPSTASWRSRVSIPLTPGRWALMGTAPLPAGKGSVVVLIRTLKP